MLINDVIPQTRVNIVQNTFDFGGMITAIGLIMEYEEERDQSKLSVGLIDLKNELNKFFKDSICKEIIYTNNTDKMFFGMTIMPYIKTDNVYSLLNTDEKIRISEYYLELDSKLFDPILDLTVAEIVAILLHEVGHLVNDSSNIQRLRKNIMNYTDK